MCRYSKQKERREKKGGMQIDVIYLGGKWMGMVGK